MKTCFNVPSCSNSESLIMYKICSSGGFLSFSMSFLRKLDMKFQSKLDLVLSFCMRYLTKLVLVLFVILYEIPEKIRSRFNLQIMWRSLLACNLVNFPNLQKYLKP